MYIYGTLVLILSKLTTFKYIKTNLIFNSSKLLESYFTTGDDIEDNSGLVSRLKDAGYDVIISIGNLEENKIGSNCGQFIRKYTMEGVSDLTQGSYSYVTE